MDGERSTTIERERERAGTGSSASMPAATRRVARCISTAPSCYRYLLEVCLTAKHVRHPWLAVILKNPSTATAARRNPTVGKVEA